MPTDGTITLVPSVHFSPAHRRRVRETIREAAPDLVAVELGEPRFERIGRRPDGDLLDLSGDRPPAAVAALRAIQRSVVRLYGLDPESTDMAAAIDEAAERGTDVALVDDPVGDTVAALADRVGLDTLPKALVRTQLMGPAGRLRQLELLSLPFRDVEHGDDVQPAIDHLREVLPEVAGVLIDDRDRAMARRLDALRRRGSDVVAVIGAGHHNGVLEHLDALAERDDPPDVAVPIRSPGRSATRIPVE